MILRFVSYFSLLLMLLLGLNVAVGQYSSEIVNTYFVLSIIFVVLCVAVYVLSASFPNSPGGKSKSKSS